MFTVQIPDSTQKSDITMPRRNATYPIVVLGREQGARMRKS
jgi:hypothetical protein